MNASSRAAVGTLTPTVPDGHRAADRSRTKRMPALCRQAGARANVTDINAGDTAQEDYRHRRTPTTTWRIQLRCSGVTLTLSQEMSKGTRRVPASRSARRLATLHKLGLGRRVPGHASGGIQDSYAGASVVVGFRRRRYAYFEPRTAVHRRYELDLSLTPSSASISPAC